MVAARRRRDAARVRSLADDRERSLAPTTAPRLPLFPTTAPLLPLFPTTAPLLPLFPTTAPLLPLFPTTAPLLPLVPTTAPPLPLTSPLPSPRPLVPTTAKPPRPSADLDERDSYFLVISAAIRMRHVTLGPTTSTSVSAKSSDVPGPWRASRRVIAGPQCAATVTTSAVQRRDPCFLRHTTNSTPTWLGTVFESYILVVKTPDHPYATRHLSTCLARHDVRQLVDDHRRRVGRARRRARRGAGRVERRLVEKALRLQYGYSTVAVRLHYDCSTVIVRLQYTTLHYITLHCVT